MLKGPVLLLVLLTGLPEVDPGTIKLSLGKRYLPDTGRTEDTGNHFTGKGPFITPKEISRGEIFLEGSLHSAKGVAL